jgi:hypothetical protein
MVVQRRHIWTKNDCFFITLQDHLHITRRSRVYFWILAYLDLHDSFSYWIVEEKPHESTVTSFKTWLIGDYRSLKSKKRWSGFTWRASTDHWWTTILSTTPWITWYYCITCWRWGSSSKRRYESVTTTEQCRTVQYFHNVNYLLFNPSVYFFHMYMYIVYCTWFPCDTCFIALYDFLDFKIRGAVRRWLKLPN